MLDRDRGLGGDLPRLAPGVRARRRRRHPWVSEVYEETRSRLVDVAIEALGLPDDALRRQLVLAWFAFTEDLVGQWTRDPSTMTRADLLALLRDVLDHLTVA